MPTARQAPEVELVPWSEAALPLLHRINTPEMRHHLGGPEPAAALLARHQLYLSMPELGLGEMFAVHHRGEPVGSVAHHRQTWEGEPIDELGWNVLPPHQGRGLATAAVRALITRLALLPPAPTPTALHAFPAAANAPSNALCRTLGFTDLGPCLFTYPRHSSHHIPSHHWRLPLPSVPAAD